MKSLSRWLFKVKTKIVVFGCWKSEQPEQTNFVWLLKWIKTVHINVTGHFWIYSISLTILSFLEIEPFGNNSFCFFKLHRCRNAFLHNLIFNNLYNINRGNCKFSGKLQTNLTPTIFLVFENFSSSNKLVDNNVRWLLGFHLTQRIITMIDNEQEKSNPPLSQKSVLIVLILFILFCLINFRLDSTIL